jgi:hypothetical protein
MTIADLTTMFKSFGLLFPKHLNYLVSNISVFSVPDKGYSRSTLCALNPPLPKERERERERESPHDFKISKATIVSL